MSLVFKSASELARMIREKEFSSLEVLEAYLAQIKEHNSKLNAIVTLDEEGARKKAREADEALARGEAWGELHGVPMTVKDVFETEGMLTTVGKYRDYVPDHDSIMPKRLKDSGAIIFGKTNTPAAGGDGQTNNAIFGKTNNPWDITRTCGGSSGGAAVAVATGMTSFEIGSDLCGSIRVPAAFCGVYGMKCTSKTIIPTQQKSSKPIMPHPLMLEQIGYGCLARTVKDLKLTAPIMYADSYRPATKKKSLKELKIAYIERFKGIPISNDVSKTIENFAAKLKNEGFNIEKAEPKDFNYYKAVNTSFEIYAVMDNRPPILNLFPAKIYKLLIDLFADRDNPVLYGFLNGLKCDLKRFKDVFVVRDQIISLLEEFLQKYDAWICPVSSTPAFQHVNTLSLVNKLKKKIDVDGKEISYLLGLFGHVNVFSLTGSPAITLPTGIINNGLPIGVQMIGKRNFDMELLDIAEEIEKIVGFQRPNGF